MLSNKRKSSLLLTETEGNEVPVLGGTQFECEEYQSPLERLIAHSTSEQRGDSVAVSAPWNERDRGNDRVEADGTSAVFPRAGRRIPWTNTSSQNLREKPSLLTLAASTCCILQVGFIWASFLSPSWLDTRLSSSLLLPSIKIETNTSKLVHSTTLGSLLGDFLGGDQHWAAVALVLTSMILPCLCGVCCILWIIEDTKGQYLSISTRDTCLCPRIFIEYVARIGFCLFFILLILDIGTSPLEIMFMESKFIVVNEIRGGMASYTLGMLFGLTVLVLLRIGRTNSQRILKNASSENFIGKEREHRDNKFSWKVHSGELITRITNKDEDISERDQKRGELRMSLLRMECSSEKTLVNRNPPSLDIEKPTEALDKHMVDRNPLKSKGLQSWKRITLYELALISTMFWIPTIFLPLFHLKYEGMMSHLMSKVSFSFRLKDFPGTLWERGVSAGVNRFVLCVLEITSILLVLVFPIIATLSATGTWIFDTRSSNFCKRLLWSIQPFLGVVVFGAALYISIPTFETVLKTSVEKLSSGICSNFELNYTDACFAIKAEPSLGLYFLLVEAMALELFVVLTLSWHN